MSAVAASSRKELGGRFSQLAWWSSGLRRGVLRLVIAGLAVASAALVVVYVHEHGLADDRAEAQAAAVQLTPRMLTFDYRTIGPDAAKAKNVTTGKFAAAVSSFVDEHFAAGAVKQELVTTATVRDSAVVSSDTNRVVVMLLVDQISTSKALTAPRIDNVCIRVTMAKNDGRWLLSDLEKL
ncbi:MAG TPA: hypothetical protein VH084_29720 [Mycobacterium sp.]|jgi:Mce-associated membrane protein|nr:hypothetical protein [Mycobacterium sp.]